MPRPVRAPFPYDLIFNGVGVLLGVPEKGAPLVATKPQDLSQVAPPGYGYSAASPIVERVQPYGDLTGGFGQKVQQSDKDNRYYYALGVDCSVGLPWQKGPAITTYTPGTVDSTNGITHFFELAGTLYALNGRYAQARASDSSWTVSQDFGAGHAATDVIVVAPNSGTTTYAYVAMGDTVYMWRYDNISWTQHGSLYARAFVTSGREFWRANAINNLAKCDTNADPWTAANWTTANSFTVGDASSPIQRLTTTVNGTLIILKQDGVYTLDDAGFDHNLYPYLKFAPTGDDGKVYGQWLNDIYLTYGKGTFRIHPMLVFGSNPHLPIEEIGPERLPDNDSPVHGRLTAFVGHETFCLYGALYNDDSGASYLLKFGAWADGQQGPQRVEVWHGSICSAFASKKIQCLYVSTIGAPANHKRCYIGFSDGTIGWFTLPCTPNPAACSSYPFATTDGTLYLPQFHGGFINDTKVVKAITVSGLNLSGTDTIQVQLETDPGLGYAVVANSNGVPLVWNQTPKQKIILPSATTGTLIGPAVVFKSSDNTSPQVTGLGMHHAVRPPLVLTYAFDVLADNGLVKRDATIVRMRADDIRDLVRAAAESAGPVTVTLPDESAVQLAVVAYAESQSWSERLRKWYGSVHVEAASFDSSSNLLLLTTGTLGELGQYTLSQLSVYSLTGLTTLTASTTPSSPVYGTLQRLGQYELGQLANYRLSQLTTL